MQRSLLIRLADIRINDIDIINAEWRKEELIIYIGNIQYRFESENILANRLVALVGAYSAKSAVRGNRLCCCRGRITCAKDSFLDISGGMC